MTSAAIWGFRFAKWSGLTRDATQPRSVQTQHDMVAEWSIRPYRAADETAVIELWRSCDLIRWADPRKEIARKLKVQPECLLVGERAGEVIATCMVGYEGHRGWINLLAVAPVHQRVGYGRAIMAEAERLLRAAGCPKINLQVRASNRKVIAFYKKLGFETENLAHMGKRLERD